MKRELDYLVKIEGNEALLDRFIEAIFNNTCLIADDYPSPYVLESGERFYNGTVIDYFFQTTPFSEERYTAFFEKLRALSGFNSYYYTLGEKLKKLISTVFPQVSYKDSSLKVDTKQEPLPLTQEQDEILRFLCYLAIGHIKYDASYATITANKYFNLAKRLGSKRVDELYQYGAGTIANDILVFQDKQVDCIANDVTATIRIKVQDDTEQTYRKVLTYINKLLKDDFPKSYAIEFEGPNLKDLKVDNLPECGQRYLFATAVQYEALHPLMIEYINTVMRKWEWYTNVDEEVCTMPSTFAVMALGLWDRRYFNLLINYYHIVDGDHQYVHQNYTLPFLQKYGIDAESIKVYIQGVLSVQEQPHEEAYTAYFTSTEVLKLLLDSKEHFATYYFSAEDLEDFEDSGNEVEEMAEYCWENVMYTTFGLADNYPALTQDWSTEAITLFKQLTETTE
ncbi:DUF6138 family protein [Myroides albus]|uniref:Uncharacterized protein n=1 Tax=Myroides albus TaxID=2562892 RepID=A0A6I3LME4_9FLAO|nr:DUF6138 family protein [Myroides albus]MTG99493.1 hypothetical protein [Myroides albus]UVD78457.1 DUF6138 family protein [Myroides albus]